LAGLEAEIPALEERADGLRARLEGVQVFRNELEAAQEDQVAKTAALAVSEQRLAEANREVDSAAQFERQAEEKQAKASALKKEVEALVEDLANIERRERVIKEKAQRHPKAEQALRDRRLDMEQEDKRAKAADRLCAEDLHPKLKAVEAEILRYEALGKLRNLEKRQKELDAQATRLKKKRAQVAAQQQKLADITAPSPKEATKFRQLMANARTAQAQADAAAIFVEFKLKGGKGSLESEPPAPVADDGAFLVTEPTRFTLKGVGDMKVWGGGSSLEEARTRLDEAQRETAEQKARFSVQDEAGFEELLQARTRLEAEVKGLVRELEELAGDAAPDDELKQVLKGIKQEEAACKGLPPEALAWGGQRIRTHNEKLQKEKSRLVRELKVKREEAETARDRHSTLAAGHGALVADVAELSTGQQALQEENAETLRKYGTLLRLKGLKVETEEALTAAAKAADEGSKELALRVEAPRALLRQAEAEIKRLTKDIQDSKSTVVDRLARIEQETANGSYTALADLEIQLADRKVRIEVVRRRAEAVKLLNDLVATLQSSETADLAGPISELMASWLALLTGGAYPRLEMVGLVPSGVHVAKYGEALPLVSLSYGMHEQVILLLRLAMGVLLSKSRRELVVLDDRLVNADPVRMKRLCLILTEAAASCQIIISTCNDTPYAGLNAHTLSVPAGGRASEVPLA
jgi:hypothetical protein